MYTSIYIYRVPRRHVAAFLRVQAAALAIYRAHGALDDATYAPADLAARYGCAGFADAIGCGADEELYLSVSQFRDRAHHDEVMAIVDSDPQIAALYDEVVAVLDVGRIIRGEFERAV